MDQTKQSEVKPRELKSVDDMYLDTLVASVMLVCPKLLKTVIVSQDLSVFSTQFIQQQSSFKEPETCVILRTFISLQR